MKEIIIMTDIISAIHFKIVFTFTVLKILLDNVHNHHSENNQYITIVKYIFLG